LPKILRLIITIFFYFLFGCSTTNKVIFIDTKCIKNCNKEFENCMYRLSKHWETCEEEKEICIEVCYGN